MSAVNTAAALAVHTPPNAASNTPSLNGTQDGKAASILEEKAAKHPNHTVDTESLNSDTTLVSAKEEGLHPAFLAKANVLNKAIADIGFGRYQYELFFSGGFGWFADNM